MSSIDDDEDGELLLIGEQPRASSAAQRIPTTRAAHGSGLLVRNSVSPSSESVGRERRHLASSYSGSTTSLLASDERPAELEPPRVRGSERLITEQNTRARRIKRSLLAQKLEQRKQRSDAAMSTALQIQQAPADEVGELADEVGAEETGNDNGSRHDNDNDSDNNDDDDDNVLDLEVELYASAARRKQLQQRQRREQVTGYLRQKSKPILDVLSCLWYFRWQLLIVVLTVLAVVLVGVLFPIPLTVSVSSALDPNKRPPTANYSVSPSDGITTDVLHCSQLGNDMMQAGTAVDAVVTATLCLGVMAPQSTGLGAGGVMLLRFERSDDQDSTTVDSVAIDCRETAPLAATPQLFADDPLAALAGPLSIATPGLLTCLWTAHQRYGKLPWQTLVTPVAQLALQFNVTQSLASALNISAAAVLADPALAAVFAPNGTLLTAGQPCSWPALAATLQLVAAQGPAVFYNGTVGQQLIAELPPSAVLAAADLQAYTAAVGPPLSTFYQGYEVFAPPAPSSGPLLLMALNVVEAYNLALQGPSTLSQHQLVEALKFAFEDRGGLGDPRFVPSADGVTALMTSKQHAAKLRQRLLPYTTYPPPYYRDLVPLQEPLDSPDGGTHVSAVQTTSSCLLAVSFSSSLGSLFGSFVVSPSTGVLLNANMREFSRYGQNSVDDPYAYPPSVANRLQPGKRPLSSMAPLIVASNDVFLLALGSAGSADAVYASLQVLLNYINMGQTLPVAVTLPRIYCPFIPDQLFLELGEGNQRKKTFAAMGYSTVQLAKDQWLAVCNAVAYQPSPSAITAVADTRSPDAGAVGSRVQLRQFKLRAAS